MNQPISSPGLTDNLLGATDIMLGRESGLQRMDLSKEGLLWSFTGIIVAGLIDMSALSMLFNAQVNGQATANTAGIGKSYFVLGHLFIALVGYAASLVALYLLCRQPEEQNRFSIAVIVHNWASPIVSLATLPFFYLATFTGGLKGGENPNTVANLIGVFWIGLLLFVGFRLMRISLDVSAGRAASLFLATLAVSLICSEGLEILFGLRLSS